MGVPTAITALVDKATLEISLLLEELKIKDFPFTETVRSEVPSSDWSCDCKLVAKSDKLAVAGAGVKV